MGLVVPATLQERIVDIAHEGHMGIVKTQRSSAREGVVPIDGQDGRNDDQVVTAVYTRELHQMAVLPDSPFDEVSVDFAHVDGQTLLLVVDDCSRFPFAEPVSSGTPRIVKSDNGPPFNVEEF